MEIVRLNQQLCRYRALETFLVAVICVLVHAIQVAREIQRLYRIRLKDQANNFVHIVKQYCATALQRRNDQQVKKKVLSQEQFGEVCGNFARVLPSLEGIAIDQPIDFFREVVLEITQEKARFELRNNEVCQRIQDEMELRAEEEKTLLVRKHHARESSLVSTIFSLIKALLMEREVRLQYHRRLKDQASVFIGTLKHLKFLSSQVLDREQFGALRSEFLKILPRLSSDGISTDAFGFFLSVIGEIAQYKSEVGHSLELRIAQVQQQVELEKAKLIRDMEGKRLKQMKTQQFKLFVALVVGLQASKAKISQTKKPVNSLF
eukprot:TRINITY_DN12113_c0_g1_i1.p1 TRINITY_DN12113_c0_g1~~TRINITY_DN12113_c0_g1_i1.p1  ORF type:complete len:320 (-),score=86.65 TRINITY_DN12113_c0_g1_i1:290-1249(-)